MGSSHSPERLQRHPVFRQPFPPLREVRQRAFQPEPELGGVVGLVKVDQLVREGVLWLMVNASRLVTWTETYPSD